MHASYYSAMGVIFIPGYQAGIPVKPSLVNWSSAFPYSYQSFSMNCARNTIQKDFSWYRWSQPCLWFAQNIFLKGKKKKKAIIRLFYPGLELQLISEESCQKKPTNNPPWNNFFHLTMKHTQRDTQEYVWNIVNKVFFPLKGSSKYFKKNKLKKFKE